MLDPSARLLALLSLLQTRPIWPGSALSAELGVGGRTIRNDIERLRSLGYPIDAVRGSAGGYRLGAGAKLPPLLLDDEEAVAVVIGLRAASGVAGVQDSSARALGKLEQVMPNHLRRKVSALHAATRRGPENTTSNAEDPAVDPAMLSAVASAIRDTQLLRFASADGGAARTVEPYQLVSWQRRWYLVARDPTDGDWHTFRLDLIVLKDPSGRRFTPQPMATDDYTDFVVRNVAASGWKVHAQLVIHAPADEVLGRINAAVGVVEPVDEHRSLLLTGADSLETVAVYIGMLGLDFHVRSPRELLPHLAALGERYRRAAEGPAQADGGI